MSAPSEEPSGANAAHCRRCGAVLTFGLSGNCPACLADLAWPPDEEAVAESEFPRRLGGYELCEEVARGGFGIVYRARQLGLNRWVALKVLQGGDIAGRAARRRFFQEAEAVARLQHPGIVMIHEVGEHAGLPFFAMELVDGHSLADAVAREPLAPQRAARVMRQVAEAVQYAHARGVLHRDLKPSNILLDSVDQARVTDFGLARQIESRTRLTQAGVMMGTPSYLPPERLCGAPVPGGEVKPDANEATTTHALAGHAAQARRDDAGEVLSDIYSLGATLYHLVTGRPPFVGDSVPAELSQVAHDEPISPRRLNPTVPRDLETICLRCLEKAPTRRYPTAGELAADLNRFLNHEPIRARRVGWFGLAWRWYRRQPVVASLLLLLGVSLVSGALAVTAQWRRAERARLRSELEAYAADLRLASQAVNDGDLGRARHLLAQHRSGSADIAWRLLRNLCRGQHRSVIGTHSWIVADLAWSPDGRWLLSGGIGSGTVPGETKLWDLTASPPLATNLTLAARQVAWPASGGLFFTANQDGNVRAWDAESRTIRKTLPGRTVAASADGRHVVIGASSPFWWEDDAPVPSTLWMPESDTTRPLPPANLVAVSPDGRRAALANWKGEIHLVNLPEGSPVRLLEPAGRLWALCFSPDGRWLVGTGVRAESKIWDLTEGKPSAPVRLQGHELPTWGAAFSPDGRELVTSSSDRTLRAWRVGTWEPLGILRGHGDEAWCVAFRPGGGPLASGGKDHQILLWDPPEADAEPERWVGRFERPFLSPGGRFLGSRRSGTNWITELASGRRHAVAAGTLLGFGGNDAAIWSHTGEFQVTRTVWETGRTESTISLERETGEPGPTSLILGARGRRLAGHQPSQGLTVWDLQDGRRLCRIAGPGAAPVAIRFSEDGHWMMIVDGEAGGRLIRIRDGLTRPLTRHLDQMKDAAFSPDGRWLATASVDSTIKLWDVVSAGEIATLRGHLSQVDSVGFAPDGSTLASVEETRGVRLWHLPTRREIAVIPMADAGGWLEFVPDGNSLAVRQSEGGLRLLPAPAPDRAKVESENQ